MNIRKKGKMAVSFGLIFLLLLGLMPGGKQAVSAADNGYILLYENTFDNKLASCVNTANTYGSIIFKGNRIDSEYQGNPGIGLAEGAWNSETITYTLTSPMSSGVFSVWFDTSKLDRSTANQYAYIWLNKQKYVFYIKQNTMYGPKENFSEWGDSSVTAPYELNQVYRVNLVYDFNNRKAYQFIDDNLLSTRSIPADFTLQSITFQLSMMQAYFDNLKFEYYSTITMEPAVRSVNLTDNTVQLAFVGALNASTVSGKTVAVTNLFTGEEMMAAVNISKARLLNIIPEGQMEEGYTYMLTIPSGISGTSGGVTTESVLYLTTGKGNYLRQINLIDCLGTQYSLSRENPADIDRIVLVFSENVSAQEVTQGIRLCDAGGTEQAFHIETDENTAVLTLNNYLFGHAQYSLYIASLLLDTNYTIPLITGAGALKVKKVSILKDGLLLDDLSTVRPGDTVAVTMEFAKTYAQNTMFMASANLWNGLDMNDYDFALVSMGAADTKHTTVFEFTIASTQELTMMAFLWKGINEINPLENEFVFRQ